VGNGKKKSKKMWEMVKKNLGKKLEKNLKKCGKW
jgi:hypothetical protein